MLIDVGDTLPGFGFSVTSNDTGDLAAPTTFAVVLTAPDGTTPAVTVANPATGVYGVTYIATQAGPWRAVGTAVGNGCDGTHVLTWEVSATTAEAQPIISLDEARELLGVGIDSQRDGALRAELAATTKHVERATGRTYRRQTIVERHPRIWAGSTKTALILRRSPVASITSVTDNGATVDAALYDLDPFGVLTRTSGPWLGPVVVTYVAGATVVPDDVLSVARQVLQHLWATRSGASGSPRRATGADSPDRTLDAILARLTDVAVGIG